MTEPTWEAPGPGSWMRDDSHIPGAMTRYYAELFPPSMAEGMAAGWKRYGLPADRLDVAVVGGHMYARPHPIGQPEPKPGRTPKTPPAWLLKLLVRIHPEMRRRRKAADQAIATKLWRRDVERWRSVLAPRFREACRRLQDVEPDRLDDKELRAHIAELSELFLEGNRVHFDQNLASSFPVGEWAARTCEWTGAEPAKVFDALSGSHSDASATSGLIDAIAADVRATPGAEAIVRGPGDAAERLSRLREISPPLAHKLDAYLGEYGHQSATGFDLTDRTTLELPHVVLTSIAARLEDRGDAHSANAGERAAMELRARVPDDARSAFDEALVEARVAYGLHDEDVRVAHLWPLGLLRRALLAAGRRLTERGVISDPEHLFEATPNEVQTLLGTASGPTATELSARADERRRLSLVDPPHAFGESFEPPPLDLLPESCARLMRGVFFYLEHMDVALVAGEATTTREPGLGVQGIAASPGRYEGRARVIAGPEDFDRLEAGDVLVAWVTSPSYNVVLPLLGAVVTDKGGALCHAAIVAREFGIPAVVGTQDGTTRIPDGATVVVDGDSGRVEIRT